MNNIDAARETIKITAEGKYLLNGRTVEFPDVDIEEVLVISPEDGKNITAFRNCFGI